MTPGRPLRPLERSSQAAAAGAKRKSEPEPKPADSSDEELDEEQVRRAGCPEPTTRSRGPLE